MYGITMFCWFAMALFTVNFGKLIFYLKLFLIVVIHFYLYIHTKDENDLSQICIRAYM